MALILSFSGKFFEGISLLSLLFPVLFEI